MFSRHVSVTRHGGPETIELREYDPGAPGPGEALVKVEAAGVSYGDILMRRGVIPGGPKRPYTPGFDLTGVVERVGPDVPEMKPGTPVVALVPAGGYAERLVVPAARLVPRPHGVDAVAAAAVALNYFVAYQMLHRVARVREGQRVLVHGASGGVGIAFLQLAGLAGVECFGTTSAEKWQLVQKYGGQPIDYRRDDFVKVIRAQPGGTVAAAFDPIGGGHFNRSTSVVERGGIMVGYGQNAALVNGKPSKLIGAYGFLGGILLPRLLPNGKRTEFYEAFGLEESEPGSYREDMSTVMELLASGDLEPIIARTVSLDEAADAQRALERGAVTGKIVLTP
jgi:NADPH:quinone reductase-like Zn-dependent oxidoreductase